MEERLFRCRNCGRIRVKRSEEQRYCGRVACQKMRKNTWRREKYELDPDYRANQTASTQAWLASQGGSAAYYRSYRKKRKERQRKERQRKERQRKERQRKERQRKEERREVGQEEGQKVIADPPAKKPPRHSVTAESANSDAKMPQSPVKSGRYRLLPFGTANSDAILVELSVISAG
jgi:hypothetical protein